MKSVALRNVFHGTTTRALVPPDVADRQPGESDSAHSDAIVMWLERNRPRVLRRVHRDLCGARDCYCGGVRPR